MPLPKVKANQTKKKWDEYCMGHSIINKEYPDNKQRYAVCQSIWKKSKEKKSIEEKPMMNKTKKNFEGEIERRSFPATEMRVIRKDDEPLKFVGYAARFNSLSQDLGGFREKIDPGAFKKTLKDADVRGLFNHSSNYVLGRTSADTLSLKENKEGLWMENIPPDTQWASDLAVSVERGDIAEMSFGFRSIIDEWENKKDGSAIRTLKEVELLDVSIVTFPAYQQTSVTTRDIETKMGINQDAINRVTVKFAHDLEITDQDRVEINSTIETLQRMVSPIEGEIVEEETTKTEIETEDSETISEQEVQSKSTEETEQETEKTEIEIEQKSDQKTGEEEVEPESTDGTNENLDLKVRILDLEGK